MKAAVKPAKKHAKPQLKTSPERIAKIIAGLQKAYPGATCALVHSNPWELLVATIRASGKTIIPITLDQMNHFAGNMLQVHNQQGEKLLVMSSQA